MTVTPSEIFKLALARHREPWNWTLHLATLFCFALTLLFHSYLILAATTIFFGTGFFRLKLPEPPKNRWFTMVKRAVEWEKNWVAYPWTFRKWWRFLFTLLIVYVTIWALWTREPVTIALLIGFSYLLKVMTENKAKGIDP